MRLIFRHLIIFWFKCWNIRIDAKILIFFWQSYAIAQRNRFFEFWHFFIFSQNNSQWLFLIFYLKFGSIVAFERRSKQDNDDLFYHFLILVTADAKLKQLHQFQSPKWRRRGDHQTDFFWFNNWWAFNPYNFLSFLWTLLYPPNHCQIWQKENFLPSGLVYIKYCF